MAFYLSKEREEDVAGAYRRYQSYLHENEGRFPPGAFMLGTALWYQNAKDHRCPHDGRLESIAISESASPANDGQSITSIRTRLRGRHGDGHIELVYPQVFHYSLHSPSCDGGLGDWRYDEFTLSPAGHVRHEIEWAGFPEDDGSVWIIEASDVEFHWLPDTVA